jgi:hypothetical protein
MRPSSIAESAANGADREGPGRGDRVVAGAAVDVDRIAIRRDPVDRVVTGAAIRGVAPHRATRDHVVTEAAVHLNRPEAEEGGHVGRVVPVSEIEHDLVDERAGRIGNEALPFGVRHLGATPARRQARTCGEVAS